MYIHTHTCIYMYNAHAHTHTHGNRLIPGPMSTVGKPVAVRPRLHHDPAGNPTVLRSTDDLDKTQ